METLSRTDNRRSLPFASSRVLSRTPQGDLLYEVVRSIDGRPVPYLFKEYQILDPSKDPVEDIKKNQEQLRRKRGRAILLTEYLHKNPEVIRRIPAIPLVVAGRDIPDSVGVIVRKVGGEKLVTFEDFHPTPIRTRIEMAIDLATTVAVLHGYGIIHADLTDENILCNPKSRQGAKVQLIDMDLAAVRGRDWKPGLLPETMPPGGSYYHAPEIESAMISTTQISVQTDRWALACALHHILLKPNPIGYLFPINDEIDYLGYARYLVKGGVPYVWPVSLDTDPTDKFLAEFHSDLTSLGDDIRSLFIRTFDQRTGCRPSNRPSATEWVKALAKRLESHRR